MNFQSNWQSYWKPKSSKDFKKYLHRKNLGSLSKSFKFQTSMKRQSTRNSKWNKGNCIKTDLWIFCHCKFFDLVHKHGKFLLQQEMNTFSSYIFCSIHYYSFYCFLAAQMPARVSWIRLHRKRHLNCKINGNIVEQK